jgi:outer membrane protein OmpA-like peptidoglycan-associated protein
MKQRYFPGYLKTATIAITVGTILTGCGAIDNTEQLANQRLESARTAYGQARANLLVESYSLKTLQDAEKVLKDAELEKTKISSINATGSQSAYPSHDKKLMFNDISRLAYMSERKSQTAVALADGFAAREEVVRLGKEKAEIELQKSWLKRNLLQQDLNAKATALEHSRQQLGIADSEAERARIMADIHAQEAALANAIAYAETMEAQKAKAEAEKQTRAAEMAKNEAQGQALEAERARAELAMVMQEMAELQGQLTDRGIVLTIGDVLFATDKSDLNASAQRSMDKLAEFLQKKQNRKLLVEGHTDNVGNDVYNQGLSERRAESVKSALLKRGVADARVVTIGYGKDYPLATNDNAVGKKQNRRVEAIILNAGVSPESQFRAHIRASGQD